MPFGWAAAATVGAAVVSGAMASDASRHAANQQKDAEMAANAEQQREYDQTRADNAPLLAARNSAIGGYQSLLRNPDSITSDPGYQFGLSQGQAAIDRSAASRGGLYSGATLKALQRYGQDYGSTKFDAALGRYSTLAGLGQPGAAAIASAGQNAANNIAGNYLQQGQANAFNSLNQGNIWGNAFNQSVSQYKNWYNAPSSQGSQVTNGDLAQANMSSDPIGTLGSNKNWWTQPAQGTGG